MARMAEVADSRNSSSEAGAAESKHCFPMAAQIENRFSAIGRSQFFSENVFHAECRHKFSNQKCFEW
jgi:hypothetical protein